MTNVNVVPVASLEYAWPSYDTTPQALTTILLELEGVTTETAT